MGQFCLFILLSEGKNLKNFSNHPAELGTRIRTQVFFLFCCDFLEQILGPGLLLPLIAVVHS